MFGDAVFGNYRIIELTLIEDRRNPLGYAAWFTKNGR